MTEVTVNADSLYAKREKIHAREVKGRFDTLRTAAVVSLLALYYLLPWLSWGEYPAVLFDLPARRFHIFGLTLWPQDFIYLAWLLIMAALLLFFVTAVAGRLWCGFACPQTVWTEMFVAIERFVEGPFHKRVKLDKGPWTGEKIARKSATNFLWLAAALWTGFTFVGYFTPIRDLGFRLLALQLGPWEVFWVFFYGLATFANAGKLREQVCMYMCPYARFQSAMFDRDTLIVSYDTARGEPRGGRRRSVDPAEVGLGDCVDCNICVQACPTGIDIRKGLQYECIACASCIDGCNDVMDRMGYERGLIQYTTQNVQDGKRLRVLRPRTLIYGGVLLSLFVTFVISLAGREMLRVDVIRDRNGMYRETSNGLIENVYTLKILNKYEQQHALKVVVDGLPGVSVETDPPSLVVEPESMMAVITRVQVPVDRVEGGGHDIRFRVEGQAEGLSAERKSRFIAPSE